MYWSVQKLLMYISYIILWYFFFEIIVLVNTNIKIQNIKKTGINLYLLYDSKQHLLSWNWDWDSSQPWGLTFLQICLLQCCIFWILKNGKNHHDSCIKFVKWSAQMLLYKMNTNQNIYRYVNYILKQSTSTITYNYSIKSWKIKSNLACVIQQIRA